MPCSYISVCLYHGGPEKAWRWRGGGGVKLVMRSLENRLHNGVMEGGGLPPPLRLHPASREIREQFLFHIWWRGPWKTLFTNPNRNKAVGRSVAASCRGSIMGCLRSHWEVYTQTDTKKSDSVRVFMWYPFFFLINLTASTHAVLPGCGFRPALTYKVTQTWPRLSCSSPVLW